jgi:23S rRNA pseudouridine1911/1915/1917 synthase
MRKETIEIIYQDDDILVINKPAGVSVTKDRAGRPQLVDFLTKQIGNEAAAKLRLVHRLDKDTSGVMILARNRAAQRQFADYFYDRKIKKTYLAVVRGASIEKQGVVDAPLDRNRKNTELMMIDSRHGKQSLTEWRLLADFGLALLLAVNPLTGRTHQIRVHLASVGLPLAIDPLYAGDRPIMLSEFKKEYRLGKFQEEKPLIDRLTLHAYQLVTPAEHILSGAEGAGIQNNCFIAPLDKKFAATIKMLTKHNPKGPAAFLDHTDYGKLISARPI